MVQYTPNRLFYSLDNQLISEGVYDNNEKKNEMRPLSGAEAVTRLISCSFIPMHSPDCIDFALGFYEQVVKTVPCYDLYFLPDKRVVEFILMSDED